MINSTRVWIFLRFFQILFFGSQPLAFNFDAELEFISK